MPTDIATLGFKVDSTQVQHASRDLRDLSTASGTASQAASGLTNVITKLAVAFGAYKLADAAKDAILLAARYETLGAVMNTVGVNAGYTTGEMAAFEASLKSSGIASVEARTSLVRMVQAQMDLNDATKLGRIAQDAAVIGNINSSEAFERLVRGIQTAQTEVLRTIGINVNFEEGYKKLAKELGKTTEQLTQQEKAQARVNLVQEAGKQITGAYTSAMETAGKQITSMPRYLQDLEKAFGKAFQPALIELVKKATEEIKSFTSTLDDATTQAKLVAIGETALKLFEDLYGVVKGVGTVMGSMLSTFSALPAWVLEAGVVGSFIWGKLPVAKAIAAIVAIKGGLDEVSAAMEKAAGVGTSSAEAEAQLERVLDVLSKKYGIQRGMTGDWIISIRALFDPEVKGLGIAAKSVSDEWAAFFDPKVLDMWTGGVWDATNKAGAAVEELSDQIKKARQKLQQELALLGLEGYEREKKLIEQEYEANVKATKDTVASRELRDAKLSDLDEKYLRAALAREQDYRLEVAKLSGDTATVREIELQKYVKGLVEANYKSEQIEKLRALKIQQMDKDALDKRLEYQRNYALEIAKLSGDTRAAQEIELQKYLASWKAQGATLEQLTALRNLKLREMNKSTFEKLLDEYMNTNKLMEEAAKTAFNSLTSAYADFISDFISGNKSLADSFGDFCDAVYRAWLNLLAQMVAQWTMSGIAGILKTAFYSGGAQVGPTTSSGFGISNLSAIFSGGNASDFYAALEMGDTFMEAMSNASMWGTALTGAGTGLAVGSFLPSLWGGTAGTGSQIGGAAGGIAGSFLPIPGGSLIGSAVGSTIGSLFGGDDDVDKWEIPGEYLAHWERLAQVVGGLKSDMTGLNGQIRNMAPLAAGAGEYLGGYGAILGGVLETISELTPGTAEYADVLANQLNPAYIISAGLQQDVAAGMSNLDAHQKALINTIDALLSLNESQMDQESALIDLLLRESGSVSDLTAKYQRYQAIEEQLAKAHELNREEIEALVDEGRGLRTELGLQGSAMDNLNLVLGNLTDAIDKLNPAVNALASNIANLPDSKDISINYRLNTYGSVPDDIQGQHTGGLVRHTGGPIGYDYPEQQYHGGGSSQEVLARLLMGEYVIRKEAVDYYGQAFAAAYNNMQLPKPAAGTGAASLSTTSARPINVDVTLVTPDKRQITKYTFQRMERGDGPRPVRLEVPF